MAVSDRIRGISESPTLALNARVRELKANGADILNFTAGEPDFRTPDNVGKAGMRAIEAGMTKYTPVAGTPELRKAIAEKLERENGLGYGPGNVIVTAGGKQALYNAVMAICNPGDEVIIPAPYWVTYPEQVKLSGAAPVFAGTRKEDGFALKASAVEEKVGRKTRALMINSPNNPTGAVCPESELRKIAAIARDNDFYVISDEIYEHLVYGGSHVSIAGMGGMKERTIIVNGGSKAYAMTGWRIGWAAGPEDVVKGMTKLQSHTTSNASSVSQAAYLEALGGSQDAVKSMASEFRKRRDVIVKGLSGIPGIECPEPQGAFYVFPDITACLGKGIRDSLGLSARLLEEAGVATVPGSAFGCEGHLRLSYACSTDTIREGVERIGKFVESI